MTLTKEQIDSSVAWSRHWVKGHGDHVDPSKERMHEVIIALADQRDELVAMLNDTTVHGGTEAKVLGHAECWRLVKLAREIRMLGMQRDANP